MTKKKIRNKVLNFFNKDNFKLIKIIILFLVAVLLSFLMEFFVIYKKSGAFSIDRIIIIAGVILFTGLHLIFRLNDMYQWIYKKRFILALLFLFFAMIMKYSGSSITSYNFFVQSEANDSTYTPILGKARTIRSDEWAVNSPLIFSQNLQENENYPYFNMNIRGTKTDMFTVINAPVKDILIIGKPFNIGYLLFGNEVGLSFWWYGRLVALMLISFEFCMLLTKKNKLVSLFGMLVITFSPAVQWWYSNFIVDILIFGQLALVLIDKFMLEKKWYFRSLYILGVGFCAICYIFILYPAWMISFAYVYLAILIWIILKNRKDFHINKIDVLSIIITIILVVLIVARFFIISNEAITATLNADYPGERFEIGGNSQDNMFSYVYSIFVPLKDMINPCENSNMLSLYPMPIIIALLYLYRKRKSKDFKKILSFLIPLLLVSILLSIWCFIPTNKIFAKITLLYMIPSHRAAIALGYIQILLIIYLINNFKDDTKLLKEKVSFILSGVFATICLIFAVKYGPSNYLGPVSGFISGTIVFILFYLMFNLNKPKYKKYFMVILSSVAILSGAIVNPIIKGINVIYNKPVSLEIQKIVNENKDALWLVDNLNFTVPNYVVANGARVINSTNYYPNYELYKTLLGEDSQKEEIRKIYNRYAHVSVNIDDIDTNLELLYPDSIKININPDKLDDINVKYVLSSKNLEKYNNDNIKFEKLYDEYGLLIFKVSY